MEQMKKALENFMTGIDKDPRISLSHIGLFSVLLHLREANNGKEPFPIKRQELMRSAKISGKTTYFKILRQLHDYGYIQYFPSYNRLRQSKVKLSVNQFST